ncbi:DnaB-like helicase C-terminal domain-containing protein [Gemmatimonadota bacterium]
MSSIREESDMIEAGMAFQPVTAKVLRDLRRRQQESPRTVDLPWPTLSRMCRGPGGGRGFAHGWHVIVGGLTGGGKTLAGLNLACSAMRQGVGVMYVSLEMSHATLLTRLRAIASGHDIMSVEWGGGFNEAKAEDADTQIMELPGCLLVNPEPIWELPDISAAIRYSVRRENVRLVVIDYAQLIAAGRPDGALFERMLAVSAELTHAAKTEGVVVVTLSQLNNAATRERRHEPTEESVYGGGRLVHDCDMLLLLNYAQHKYDPIRRRAESELIVRKNRNGPTGKFPIEVDYRTLRITEFSPSG